MIGFSEARGVTLGEVKRLSPMTMDLELLPGYVSAEEVFARADLPPFDNSVMDGFAVSSSSLSSASESSPHIATVRRSLYAGDDPDTLGSADEPVRIMTGAAVPPQFDAVVKIEDVEIQDDQVTFRRQPSVGQNIRRRASYVSRGENLYGPGDRFTALDPGAIAACGISEALVYCKPRVRLCVTGDELVSPGADLSPGKIYNSNLALLSSLLKDHCAELSKAGAVDDDVSSLKEAIDCDAEALVTCGGVSMGDRDLVPAVARDCGWETMFHKVAIKPGKPFFFAKRKNQLLFGLPGNPLSAAITCLLFVIPALKKMAGREDFAARITPAQLSEGYDAPVGRSQIWPGNFKSEHGAMVATLPRSRSSANLSLLKETDGLVYLFTADEIAEGLPPVGISHWDELLR